MGVEAQKGLGLQILGATTSFLLLQVPPFTLLDPQLWITVPKSTPSLSLALALALEEYPSLEDIVEPDVDSV